MCTHFGNAFFMALFARNMAVCMAFAGLDGFPVSLCFFRKENETLSRKTLNSRLYFLSHIIADKLWWCFLNFISYIFISYIHMLHDGTYKVTPTTNIEFRAIDMDGETEDGKKSEIEELHD